MKNNSQFNKIDVKNIFKELVKNNFILNKEMNNIIDGINQNFLRFYNKITCFNTVNQDCIQFSKLNLFLNSFLPSSSEGMVKFARSVDKNFNKIEEYVADRLESSLKDMDYLKESSNNFNERIKNIFEIQKKIARIVMNLNDKKSVKKQFRNRINNREKSKIVI